jgi:hypothetical protein
LPVTCVNALGESPKTASREKRFAGQNSMKAETPGEFFKMAGDKESPITAQYRPDGYPHGQEKRIARKMNGFDEIVPEKDGNQRNQEDDPGDNPAGQGYSHLDFPDRRKGFLVPDLNHYQFLEIRRGGEKIVPQNVPEKLKAFDFLGALGAEEAVQPEPQPEAKGDSLVPRIFV